MRFDAPLSKYLKFCILGHFSIKILQKDQFCFGEVISQKVKFASFLLRLISPRETWNFHASELTQIP